MMQGNGDASSLLTGWQAVLDDRTQQGIQTLARIPGVLGLVLAGSIGRGEAWPLSDVDFLVIYEDGAAERAAREVEITRVALLDWWASEAYGGTSLDIGKLRFTRSDVTDTLSRPPHEAAHYLDDPRWFYSLDKGYRGRAVFDPEGLAAALARWITDARFTPAVVQARQQIRVRQMMNRAEEAERALQGGECIVAALALREGLHTLISALMEEWGERDNSVARLGTRFEQAAAERGEEGRAARIFTLFGLSPDQVAQRLPMAPAGIRYRHHVSLAARKLVGEPVTAAQDARDVLLIFSMMQMRRSRPPYERWIGVETADTTLPERIGGFRRLLAHVAMAHPTTTAHMYQGS